LVLYRKLAPRPILLKIQTGHGSLYRLFFFSMFRNFNTFKRGNAAGAPIQEMSAGVFGPVCRRVRIRTELCLARTSSKCFYRLAILVSRALSAATLHETCATAAQKDTTLTLRSKTQCDLFSALFRGSMVAHGSFTCLGPGYGMCTDGSQLLRSHPPDLRIQQQLLSEHHKQIA